MEGGATILIKNRKDGSEGATWSQRINRVSPGESLGNEHFNSGNPSAIANALRARVVGYVLGSVGSRGW